MGRAYQFIDKIERTKRDDVEGFSSTAEGLGKATVSDLQQVAKIRSWDTLDAELERSPESHRAAQPLRQTYAALENMGLGEYVDLDLTIVRGLAYYTGVVFELFDAGRTLRAICGGGRYDNLLDALGGVTLPAVGFGMGDVVLGELLKEQGLSQASYPSVDVFLAFVSQDDLRHVLRLAHRLRDESIRVEYAMTPQNLAKQLKLADARQARLAVLIGPDERGRGELVLKDLTSGTQENIPETAIVDTIKKRLHG
jgi:histidyl-tRNA synthetase